MGTFVPSLKVNALDLSPNFAGTLMAIVGTIGCMSGVIAPYIVGILVPNVRFVLLCVLTVNRVFIKKKFFSAQSTMEEWRDVFWLSAAILIATNLLFLQYGSGDVQPWNQPNQYQNTDVNNENTASSILKPL